MKSFLFAGNKNHQLLLNLNHLFCQFIPIKHPNFPSKLHQNLKRRLCSDRSFLEMAVNAGHESVLQEARELFDKFCSGDYSSIHPNLRSTIFNLVMSRKSF